MRETDIGTVTVVKDEDTVYDVSYASGRGGRRNFLIDKKETVHGAFIAAAAGQRIEVGMDRSGTVRTAIIGQTLVLMR